MLPIVTALISQGLGLLGNAVIAKGKNVIEDKLGVDLESTLGSEEGRLKLKQLEFDHEEFLIEAAQKKAELDLETEKEYLKDVQSARTMQNTALNQTDVFSKRFIYYFAIMWTLAAMIYIGFITFATIPENNIRFADTILGFLLGTVVAQIIAFFYGSSKSPQAKDDVISQMIKDK